MVEAAGGHADGFGPGHDDVGEQPHVDLLQEIPDALCQTHVARGWLGHAE